MDEVPGEPPIRTNTTTAAIPGTSSTRLMTRPSLSSGPGLPAPGPDPHDRKPGARKLKRLVDDRGGEGCFVTA